MDVKKVVVRKHVSGHGFDTENVAVFGTRFKFPKDLWDPFGHGGAPYAKAVKADGPECEAIFELSGLVSMAAYEHSSLYDLVVKKATAFDWGEIEPKIIALLEQRHDRLTAAGLAQVQKAVDAHETVVSRTIPTTYCDSADKPDDV